MKNKILKIREKRAAKKELADNKLVPRITNQDVAGLVKRFYLVHASIFIHSNTQNTK